MHCVDNFYRSISLCRISLFGVGSSRHNSPIMSVSGPRDVQIVRVQAVVYDDGHRDRCCELVLHETFRSWG